MAFWIQKRILQFLPFETPLLGIFGGQPYDGDASYNSIGAYWSDGFTGYGGVQFDIRDTSDNWHSANDLSWNNVPVGTWVHLAFVWDTKGIEGSTDRLRIYRDGQLVANNSDAFNGVFSNNNAVKILGHHAYSRFGKPTAYLDNIVIYDYAKTDFSDRFDENPIPTSPFCEGKVSAKVTTSGFLYSRKTKTYLSTVTVKNTGSEYVNGPVSVVFDKLPAGVSLLNPSGTSLGSPYAVIPSLSAAPDVFAPNQSVSFPVQLNATGPIKFTNTVCSGSLVP